MTCYKTEVRDAKGGTASYGTAFVQIKNGAWVLIGHTRDYKSYPRAVRARTAAKNLCLAHAKIRAISEGFEIIET